MAVAEVNHEDAVYADPVEVRRAALIAAASVAVVVGIPLLLVAAFDSTDADSRGFAVIMLLNGSALFIVGVSLLAFPLSSIRTITDLYRQQPEWWWKLNPIKAAEEPRRSRLMGFWNYVAFAGGFAGMGLMFALSSMVTLLR